MNSSIESLENKILRKDIAVVAICMITIEVLHA